MVEEQGNLEAHAILMIIDTVQCESCYFKCRQELFGVSDEVKKQALKNLAKRPSILTTSVIGFFKLESRKGKQLVAAKQIVSQGA